MQKLYYLKSGWKEDCIMFLMAGITALSVNSFVVRSCCWSDYLTIISQELPQSHQLSLFNVSAFLFLFVFSQYVSHSVLYTIIIQLYNMCNCYTGWAKKNRTVFW